MKNQRGVALSGLLFWSIVLILVTVLGMKVAPTFIEYQKLVKDIKATAAKAGPESTVAEIRSSFDKFADIDLLDIKGRDLDISKDNGRIVISFEYEKRIPLFWNVGLVIDYKGSTAN
ncbi:MAG: DUF4845 domain-containing protein [Gammaproteobacteria bacterium]|nr:DUF4845 domain-containing protein [Gammaproteobacteria bacterium]MBU1603127.1 DUF4845 domain-containing protein [Gammaproteobacteria bacterium]MBU2432647.1 DUF4845 domain-containing protein [Gammaproteobacteria bacterium]MBU2451478.1 DUF4845 domain-containing protein [Gammaproteobacteria bacterium]